jgi:PleD family two-component response regulator
VLNEEKMRVLVVDDSQVDIQIALQQLSHDFNVTFSLSAADALFYAHQIPQPEMHEAFSHNTHPVTLSIGMASTLPDNESCPELLDQQALNALHSAQAAGGNTWTMAKDHIDDAKQ